MPPLEARNPARIRKEESDLVKQKRLMEKELRTRAIAACVEYQPGAQRSRSVTYRTSNQAADERTTSWIVLNYSGQPKWGDAEFRSHRSVIAEDGTETIVKGSNMAIFSILPGYGLVTESGHDLSTQEKVDLLQDGLDTISLIELASLAVQTAVAEA